MASQENNQAGESKEEKIGFHKGSLATLAKERQELLRIVGVVEQLMQIHVKALQDLGVDITAELAGQQQEQQPEQKQNKPSVPIDDLLQ
ncbi:hypothetical protein D6764_01280 [Candidatus Woesearchaeota archaeon]|nr:MAG: hypothetical protein D6764_01280 [Candidatus Woesearchaeota archaeon]